MADLITPRELAVWTSSDVDEVTADPFALEVMLKVSELVRFLGGHPDWEYATAPFDVKMVVLLVSKRTYENPTQEVSGNVGPIGTRVLDVAALLTELTPTERATVTKYNPEGDPDGSGAGDFFVMRIGGGLPSAPAAVLYTPDDSLSDWYIPMFEPGDPGDPALYDETP